MIRTCSTVVGSGGLRQNLLNDSYSSFTGLAEPQRSTNIFLTFYSLFFFILLDLFHIQDSNTPLHQNKRPEPAYCLFIYIRWMGSRLRSLGS